GGGGAVVLLDSVLRPPVGPHRAQEYVHDRRAGDGPVRLRLFRHAGDGAGNHHLPRHRAVAGAARHDVWPASRADRRKLHRTPSLQRRLARLSACLGHRRWTRAADRHLAVRPFSLALAARRLHRAVCGAQPDRDRTDERLHGQGHRRRIRIGVTIASEARRGGLRPTAGPLPLLDNPSPSNLSHARLVAQRGEATKQFRPTGTRGRYAMAFKTWLLALGLAASLTAVHAEEIVVSNYGVAA